LATRGWHYSLETNIPESDASPEGEHPKIVILIGQDADQIKPASGPQAPFMVFGGEPKAALNVRKISKVMADQIHVTRICVTICSRDQF